MRKAEEIKSEIKYPHEGSDSGSLRAIAQNLVLLTEVMVDIRDTMSQMARIMNY